MAMNENELLKNEYLRYIKTEESSAVYFVKNLKGVDSEYKWIDIINSERYPDVDNKPVFKYVRFELFERKIKPNYPKGSDVMLMRAITWEAAHEDIKVQRSCGIRGPVFEVTGCSYNKNRGKFENRSFNNWNEEYGGFDYTGKAPTTTIIRRVIMEPKWIYEISGIRRIDK